MGCAPSRPRVKDIHKEKPPPIQDITSDDGSFHNSQRSFCSFGSLIEQNGGIQIFEWEFGREIGKGAMSRVYITTNVETGHQCAAKVYNKTKLLKPTLGSAEIPFDKVKWEIQIMAEVTHPNILPIDEVIEDDYSDSFILLMPLSTFGTLTNYKEELIAQKKTEDEIQLTMKLCFFQIASALSHIHSNNIVHRDIKPDNILVFSEDDFKLSDFSESTKLDNPDEKVVDTKGSPPFMSPEELSGEIFDPKPADVWAYGTSIYLMMFGLLPFGLNINQGRTIANTVFTVTMLLEKNELELPACDEDLGDLLTILLQKDPTKRPTFEEVMRHAWFDDVRQHEPN
ncbi:CAMK family protein kinase [Tritrichomonas foetus]|uniref:CAMK family protein kinase n=1 Tax=Tritrichomonas foetus TaxID=1144522 RepID=A0A1J4JNT0_9EUKA|nr:CAMK family protein kinase [Tritrichomonas foetus]|eukprot:OHT00785.1 CAMK family protein kinase [Tritrichomonas foetus]